MENQGTMRSVFQTCLKKMGFTSVDCVMDGSEGLLFLQNNAVDLVICDWDMPKTGGLEVLQVIRSCENTRNLPFIMVSSSSEQGRIKSAIDSGVSDFLIKPFQPVHLAQKVVHLLTHSVHRPERLKNRQSEQAQAVSKKESVNNQEQTDTDDLMIETLTNKPKTANRPKTG